MLKILRSLVREPNLKRGRTELRLTEPRGSRAIRAVCIPDWINEQLRLVKRMHKDDEFVIVGRNGGIESNNFASHYYSNFLNSAGVKYRLFSATRNTFIKSSIESGISAEELSRQHGEPSTEYTMNKYYRNRD